MGTRPSLDLIFVLLAEGINFVTIVNNSVGDLKELLRRVLLSKRKFTMPAETRETALEPEKMQVIQLCLTNKSEDAGAHRNLEACSKLQGSRTGFLPAQNC